MSRPIHEQANTVEELSQRWLDAQPESFWLPSAGTIAEKAYEAGYLQGVSDALTGPQEGDDDA